jgi:hypothetical protein
MQFSSQSVCALCCLIILGGCAPPRSSDFRPFGNGENWIVKQDLVYQIGDTNATIVVPAGFVTDFASIPPPLGVFGLSPVGQYGRAAVIHDYLYWTQVCAKDQADNLLLVAMKESDVGWFKEHVVHLGVSWFGGFAWRGNAKERDEGLLRIVPEGYRDPPDPNMSWKEYRKKLVETDHLKDPSFEANPPYCVYGDSTKVP